MNRIPRTLLYAFLPAITLAMLLASQRVHSAGLFTVNSTADTADASPGNGSCADSSGKCTLRAAIQEANALAGTDSIHFAIPAADPGCTGGVCVIDLQSALPDLTSMFIFGPGRNLLTVRRSTGVGTPRFRVFTITSGVTVEMLALTISNGFTGDGASGSGGRDGGNGGGIFNGGALTLSSVTVSGNQTGAGGEGRNGSNGGNGGDGGNGGNGGGIFNAGALTLSSVTVSGNHTGNGGDGGNGVNGGDGGNGGNGGGISGAMTLTNSTVSGNQTGEGGNGGKGGNDGNGGDGGGGGGIDSSGTVTLTNSAVNSNQTGAGAFFGGDQGGKGGDGGGIRADTLTVTDSIVSSNQTGRGGRGTGIGGNGGNGGGINAVVLTLTNSTVSSNQTGMGGPSAGDTVSATGGNGGDGGGIDSSGTQTLTNSIVSSNQTGNGGIGLGRLADEIGGIGGNGGSGGGVIFRSFGALTMTNSTVSGNGTGIGGTGLGHGGKGGNGGDGGGGIFTAFFSLTVTNSTISGNRTGIGGDGGESAFRAGSGLTGTGGNGGDGGGGIFSSVLGTETLTNITVSGNRTGDGGFGCTSGGKGGNGGNGGGIISSITMTLANSTVSNNQTGAGGTTDPGGLSGLSGDGGGIYRDSGPVVDVLIRSTIIAANSAATGPDIKGAVQSDGYNLIQNTSGATINQNPGAGPNIIGKDPLLSPLAFNGGPTQTHALRAGSPAIDRGKKFTTNADQRGLPRPVDLNDATYPDADDASDIGAFEAQSSEIDDDPPAVISIDDGDVDDMAPVGTTLTYTMGFSEDIDASTVTSADFDNGGTSSINIGAVTETSPTSGVFTVAVTPTTAGTLRLRIPPSAVIRDLAGNQLDTDPAVLDDTTVTVIAAVPPEIFVRDGKQAEPAASSANMIFTVTLSAPALGPLAVNFTTADEPAGIGKAIAGQDYTTSSGTVNFAAGEILKTISVPILSDVNSEPDETFFVNLTGATGSFTSIADNQATGAITAANPAGTLLISELRFFGPGGGNDPNDEYVEIYNNTDTQIDVPAGGYGLFRMGSNCTDAPVLIGTIPAMTSIPARGHYLFAGPSFSAGVEGPDALFNPADVPPNSNVALFSVADITMISTANRLDAVGFGSNTGEVCDLLRESTTVPAVAPNAALGQHAFLRDPCGKGLVNGIFGLCPTTGNPKDSNTNLVDFVFVETNATSTPAGQRLGAPGPENLLSPVRRDATIGAVLVDATRLASQPPNQVRNSTSEPMQNSTFGTLSISRRFVNNTGGTVTRLRFRIVDITTMPVTTGIADLRARTSSDITFTGILDAGTCAATGVPATVPCQVTIHGTTLSQPPMQPNGGGTNTTLSVMLSPSLAPNASINVQFLLGVQQTGSFKFYIIIEALP